MPSILFHEAAIQKLCTGALAYLHAALTESKQIPLSDPFLQMGARLAAETILPESRLLLLLRSIIEHGLHDLSHGTHPTKIFNALEKELSLFLDHFTPASKIATKTFHLDCLNLSPSPRTLNNVHIVISCRPSIQEVILLLRKSGSILLLVDAIGDVALSTLILNRFYTKEPICVVKKGSLLPPVQTAAKAYIEEAETALLLPGHQEQALSLLSAPPLSSISPHTASLFTTPITHSTLTRSLVAIRLAARTLFLSPVLISKSD